MNWFIEYGNFVCSVAAGLAIAWSASTVLLLPRAAPVEHASRYENERRRRMRSGSSIYAWCESLVDELADRAFLGTSTSSLAGAMRQSTEWNQWKPAEYLATKTIEGVLVGAAIFALVSVTGFFWFAAAMGSLLTALYPTLAARSIHSRAAQRLKIQRNRLPMAVDQIALMMQAGASFEDCLRSIVDEAGQHPLSQELAAILGDVDAGRCRREALLDWKERMADGDVAELVFAITKGEELGTPLSAILSEQAEQMRIKRSQWGEKAAAEAEVQIVFPGMLVMIACLIVILAPILLPAAFNVFAQGR